MFKPGSVIPTSSLLLKRMCCWEPVYTFFATSRSSPSSLAFFFFSFFHFVNPLACHPSLSPLPPLPPPPPPPLAPLPIPSITSHSLAALAFLRYVRLWNTCLFSHRRQIMALKGDTLCRKVHLLTEMLLRVLFMDVWVCLRWWEGKGCKKKKKWQEIVWWHIFVCKCALNINRRT